jgi:hypothetical protein
MVDDPRDAALRWLRPLAQDVLEHESCWGCKMNAAQALDAVGALGEVLAQLNIEDPRGANRG